MYSSDPRPDTGSLMQLESLRAVSRASQPPKIQSLSQDILIIPPLDGREVKSHCRLRDHAHFFHFLVFRRCQPICGIIIANESFSSAKPALVCSIRASGKNRRHLGCSNFMRNRGCSVQNKGITLRVRLSILSLLSCEGNYLVSQIIHIYSRMNRAEEHIL